MTSARSLITNNKHRPNIGTSTKSAISYGAARRLNQDIHQIGNVLQDKIRDIHQIGNFLQRRELIPDGAPAASPAC